MYDPTLPVGSGLLVDGQTMICGTARYAELTVRRYSTAEALGLPICYGTPLPDITEAQGSGAQEIDRAALVQGPGRVDQLRAQRSV